MSAIAYVSRYALPAAFRLLEEVARDLRHPAAGKLDHPDAKRLELAIGLQESRFEYRFQIGGPAHGFYQSEYGGGAWTGILTHAAARDLAREVLNRLAYGEPDITDYRGVAHNDVLASAFARLLMWTHPLRLPMDDEPAYAWTYYFETWRPGIPHPETWMEMWRQAQEWMRAA